MNTMISWLFTKLRNSFSTNVPPELAACEFECREKECRNEDFLVCTRRLEKAEAIQRVSEKDINHNP